jgi:hypothetical protein
MYFLRSQKMCTEQDWDGSLLLTFIVVVRQLRHSGWLAKLSPEEVLQHTHNDLTSASRYVID